MVKIWTTEKNLQYLRGQNHCKNVRLVKRLAIYHDFYGLKLSYHFFITKTIIKEIRWCKEKQMLMDYFSCYKLNNKSTHFEEEKNSPKLKDCKVFIVIKVLCAFQKKLVLIILVQRLHSIIMYVGCYSSLRWSSGSLHYSHRSQYHFIIKWCTAEMGPKNTIISV